MKAVVVAALLLSSLHGFAQSTTVKHVIVVVEENHSYESVIGSKSMPYLNSLASRYSLAVKYYADAHNSIPNYFWMTAGAPVTYDDGTAKNFDVDNIVRHLLVSGLTWKTYAESIPYTGYIGYDTGYYVKHHNPFAYFTDVRNSSEKMNIVPMTHLLQDASAGRLPNFAFVIPNEIHNAHNGSLSAADQWLQEYIKPILGTAPFQAGGSGLLIIVFDESFQTDCRTAGVCKPGYGPFGGRVVAVLGGPQAKASTNSYHTYSHENLLSTVCYALKMSGCPGKGGSASAMTDMLR